MEGMGGIDPNTLLATMGSQKNGSNDNMLLLFLLLIFYRRDGVGTGIGGEGIRSVATQNDIAQQTQFIASQNTSTLRDLSDIRSSIDVSALTNSASFKDLQSVVQAGNAAISRELCDCCCKLGIEIKDTQRAVEVGNMQVVNAIDKCCCLTQSGQKDIINAICNQTNTLTNISTQNTQRIIDQMNVNSQRELEQKLHECQDQLSNSRQTATILEAVRAQCGPQHHCGPWWHPPVGNGGNGNGGPPA